MSRPGRMRALLKLPALIAGGLLLPFRRRRKARGISGDTDQRRQEMLAMTAGLARTVGGARVRSLFRGREKKAQLREAALQKATTIAVEQLGSMKGLSMKLGQMMSYLNVLSEEAEDQMAELQASVPPMDRELVDAVVADQLGDTPDRVFAHFDIEPIAAASVGQVHRARLHDGRSVAVKIQYPGVNDALRADLENMEGMMGMAALTMKADLTDYFGLISGAFLGELDYCAEAANQQRLADMYRGHPYVLVPDTVPELCRPRLMVSEFIDAQRFKDAVSSRAQEDRDAIGEIMYRFAFGCIMNGFFSGDPHPGNYLFPADGRVCFLDFGMVVQITDAEHAGIVAGLIAGGLHGREDLIDAGLRRLGFLPEGGPKGVDVWEDLKGIVVGPIDHDEIAPLDRKTFRAGLQNVIDPRSDLNRAGMKTESFEGWAAILMRYSAGSLAAISKFAPRANWRHIIEEIVLGAPPQTPIGKRWGPAPGGAEFVGSRVKRDPA